MLSLDQETSLWDGVPYSISFSQDFSQPYLDNLRIIDIPVSAIIQAIAIQPDVISENSVVSYQSGEDYRKSKEFWEWFEKHEKDERKREKKWRKKHPKLKNQKQAKRNVEQIIDNLMKG